MGTVDSTDLIRSLAEVARTTGISMAEATSAATSLMQAMNLDDLEEQSEEEQRPIQIIEVRSRRVTLPE